MQFLLRKLRKSGIIKVQINTKTQQKSKHSAILKERQVLQYMGKDLKGKELGKGLTQRDDGRYNARAVINGVQICLFSHNLNHLKREFAAEKDKVLTKQLSAAIQTYTLDEWFNIWFTQYKEPTLKNTGTSYYRQYKNYYGCRIGTKKLTEIRQLDVQTAIADMLKAGRTSKSVREATGILRQCVEAAIANGYMTLNPVVGTQIPTCETAERRVLTRAEQKEFLEYLEETKSFYEPVYKFALSSGLRCGEIGGLQWSDIDFTNKCIYIRRQLMCQYENGVKTEKLTSPKTSNSVRKIPFFGETEKILMQWKEKVETKKKELGDRWRMPEEYGDLVFCTSMGSPLTRYNLESDMRYVSKQINQFRMADALEKGTAYVPMDSIHPHALRHTFATRCFEAGMSPRTVMSIMGHSSYQVTLSYTHLLDDVMMSEAEKVGNFLDIDKPVQVNIKSAQESFLGLI